MQGGWEAHGFWNQYMYTILLLQIKTWPRRSVSILGVWGNTIMHARVPISFVYK